MTKKLLPWCKLVKITLIKKDMNISDLADNLGMERTYLSAVINGRQFSEPTVKRISDYLDISDDYSSPAITVKLSLTL